MLTVRTVPVTEHMDSMLFNTKNIQMLLKDPQSPFSIVHRRLPHTTFYTSHQDSQNLSRTDTLPDPNYLPTYLLTRISHL